MIDELELPVANAELIIEKAIEAGVYSDDMPESDKDKIEAAHEQLSFMIDSVKDDDVTPDNEDPDIAKAAKQIYEIFEIAGIEVAEKKGKNVIVFGEVPEVQDEDDDEEDDFDPDSVISGYAKKSATAIVKKFESGDIDADDIEKVQEWEKEEGKGREQIVDWEPEESEDEDEEDEDEGMTRADLDDLSRTDLKKLIKDNELDITVKKSWDDDELRDKIAEAAGLEAGDDDEEDEDEESEDEAEGGEDKPWDEYDDETVKSIKEAVEAAQEDEDEPLEAEQVEAVIAYEKANKNRASLVKWLEAKKEELSEEGDDSSDDEEEEEEAEDEKPAKKTSKKSSKKEEPEEEDEDEGVTSITLTRDQILTALTEGEVEIEV